MDTKEAGRKGGLQTKKLHGIEHFRKIRAIPPKKGRRGRAKQLKAKKA